jgi:hypothetical protein
MAVISVRDDGALGPGVSGGGENWFSVLKAEPPGFVDGLDAECERGVKRGFNILGLSNWENLVAIN